MSEPQPKVAESGGALLLDVDRATRYATVVSNGQSALRALLTMNGGAILVFLTFLGHLWDKAEGPIPSIGIFVGALSWFICGIALALVAYSFIFVSNCFSLIDRHGLSDGALVVTFIGGLGSLICFPIGSWRAIEAFQSATALLPR
ncbi:MAG TPA: hypothetical protein VGR02_13560 [Thermoanaerobaculia bacterium]|jgi:hypothetical protein|nr:hypothetical protein [Thermoanaerobaculia bacterium]